MPKTLRATNAPDIPKAPDPEPFFSALANGWRAAKAFEALMNRSDSALEAAGTTREAEIRRLVETHFADPKG